MKFLDVRNLLGDRTTFTISDLRKIEPDFDRRRLVEWQKKGYIKKIIKNFYVFSEVEITEAMLFVIANTIRPNSYVSFEMALAHYQLIPESVYGITSATTKKTAVLETPLGDFIYRSLKPELFFGYTPIPYQKHHYLMAEAEKALLDYLYLHPGLKSDDDFGELRMNREELFARLDSGKLEKYLAAFGNQALNKRTSTFLKFIRHADL